MSENNFVPLDEFKKSLGKLGETLNEEQILKLREVQDRLADAVFDYLLKKRNNLTK